MVSNSIGIEQYCVIFFVLLQIFYSSVVYHPETVFDNTVVAWLFEFVVATTTAAMANEHKFIDVFPFVSRMPWFRLVHTRQPSKRRNNAGAK